MLSLATFVINQSERTLLQKRCVVILLCLIVLVRSMMAPAIHALTTRILWLHRPAVKKQPLNGRYVVDKQFILF